MTAIDLILNLDQLPQFNQFRKENSIQAVWHLPEFMTQHPLFVRYTRLRFKFKSGEVSCVRCGLQGTLAIQYRHLNEDDETIHIDLFGVKGDRFKMLTLDHILPRSWGGTAANANMQTMCSDCNHKKGNTIPAVDARYIVENFDMLVNMEDDVKYARHLRTFFKHLKKEHPHIYAATVVEVL